MIATVASIILLAATPAPSPARVALNDLVGNVDYYQAERGTAVGTALREFFSPENPPTSTLDRRLGPGSSRISDRNRSDSGVGLSLCTGNSREPAFDSFCSRGGCAFVASVDAKLETAFVRDR